MSVLNIEDLRRMLQLRDLTNPTDGAHAMQQLVDAAVATVSETWNCQPLLRRSSPIVSVADNYDRLHYPPDGVSRDARYTRYLCETALLRTQTSAMIPPLLCELATNEDYQLDLWHIRRNAPPLVHADLHELVRHVIGAVLPGRETRLTATEHPYTLNGQQIDVRDDDRTLTDDEANQLRDLIYAALHRGTVWQWARR
jgi:phenylalanyl-tRNA synthetase alpha chain